MSWTNGDPSFSRCGAASDLRCETERRHLSEESGHGHRYNTHFIGDCVRMEVLTIETGWDGICVVG